MVQSTRDNRWSIHKRLLLHCFIIHTDLSHIIHYLTPHYCIPAHNSSGALNCRKKSVQNHSSPLCGPTAILPYPEPSWPDKLFKCRWRAAYLANSNMVVTSGASHLNFYARLASSNGHDSVRVGLARRIGTPAPAYQKIMCSLHTAQEKK